MMKDRWGFNYHGSRIIILSKEKVEFYKNTTGKYCITTTRDRFYVLIITGRIRKKFTDNTIKSLLMVKSTLITLVPLSMLSLVLRDELVKEILERINVWTD